MPACHITISETIPDLAERDIAMIRDVVAASLRSRAWRLNRDDVVARVQRASRIHMLGEMELEVFAQFDFGRFFSRDKRAQAISTAVAAALRVDCATWINLAMVGYCRVTASGQIAFSS